MSIIIHGIEMPTNKELWMRAQPDGKIVSLTGNVIEDVSAQQIPPHGRLIDGDALIAQILNEMRRYNYDEKKILILASVMDMIDAAPTIIEAEDRMEGKTDV